MWWKSMGNKDIKYNVGDELYMFDGVVLNNGKEYYRLIKVKIDSIEITANDIWYKVYVDNKRQTVKADMLYSELSQTVVEFESFVNKEFGL